MAYADLIEEEGDFLPSGSREADAARANFIRTQVALARSGECDPLAISTRQQNPDVLTGWSMAHTLPRLPAGYSWDQFEFRRGFPWKVAVQSREAFTAKGHRLFEVAPIQALAIDARLGSDLTTLAEWPLLQHIHHLGCSQLRLGAAAINQLVSSPFATELVELAFEFYGITAEGLEVLTESQLFPRLTSLELLSSGIAPALIVDALAAVREPGRLTRLNLRANRIDRADAPHLFALPIMNGLHTLDLAENPQLGVAGARALAESGILSGLQSLNLSKTRPGVPGLRDVVETKRPTRLKSLNLAENRLGPVAIKTVAESPVATGLQVLNLANNQVRDTGAVALASAKELSGLLELNLSDAELTDAGARALADSPYLNELLSLNLTSRGRDRPFSDKTRRALAERFGQRVSC